MNYLAHAFLSPDQSKILIGNLWGDLLRPRMFPELENEVLKGVQLHLWIDQFTDHHPLTDLVRDLLRPFQHKYTPVVTDVLMDFLLSKFWSQFSNEDLMDYCDRITTLARQNIDLIPESLHYRITRMLDNNWLASCRNEKSMEVTLQMLSKRVHFENQIPDLISHYKMNEEKINEAFLLFFTELKQQAILQSEGLS